LVNGGSCGYFSCGGLFRCYRSDFESCCCRNNFSGTIPQILIGGATAFSLYGYGKIENCLFNNNVSTSGASCLYLSASETSGGNQMGIRADIINTTFANNTGTSGQVIRSHNASNCFFRNSIIYNNGSNTPFTFTGALGGPGLSNTISQGGQISGINTDPLLNPDFTLQAASSAIDSGNNTYVSAGVVYDLLGNARVHNTTVDKGAFEYDVALGMSSFVDNVAFKLFPNPTNDRVNVVIDEEVSKITVFSLSGMELLSTVEKSFSIRNLSSGIYLLSMELKDGSKGVKKLIKQ